MKRLMTHLLILAITITSIVLEPTLKSQAQQSNDNLRTVPSNSGIQHYDPVTDQYYEFKNVHRLFNPNLSEHFYTISENEAKNLIKAGWNYEGTTWTSPSVKIDGCEDVYRLRNPNNGRHFFTIKEGEMNKLVGQGWILEKIAFYSYDGIEITRLYNPYNGDHLLTYNLQEIEDLRKIGWIKEIMHMHGSPEV